MPGQRASGTQHAGTDAALALLAGAATREQATQGLLGLLCDRLRCDYAVLWTTDEAAGLLRWEADVLRGATAESYATSCRRLSFPSGAGLPGRIWAAGRPEWLADVLAEESRFARSQAAADAGLASVVALPVYGRAALVGVLELYWSDPRPADEEALERLLTIARLWGEWLEARRQEERLATGEALRAAIVNSALDCIITIDEASRIIDFNPAAERTFGWTRAQAVGSELAELVIPGELRDAHRTSVAELLAGRAPKLLDRRVELEALRADGSRFPVELTITRLQTPDGTRFVGFVRDITERRRTENELTRLLERETAERRRAERAEQVARRIARTLQRSLLPPMLPEVEQLEVAAGFHAGGREAEVGGDFYDLFATGARCWNWAIGDVCGKGTGAAALTGLARHTIRAAAMQQEQPGEVLALLNEVLLRERAGGLLTAALGRLDLGEGPARLSLAIAGHPPPVVVRARGGSELLAPTGTMLGVIGDAPFGRIATQLHPGDLLVAYTDGVIESRRAAGGRLDIEGLVAVLEGARGGSADEVAAAIERTVAPGGRVATDDDVAYLVIRFLGS